MLRLFGSRLARNIEDIPPLFDILRKEPASTLLDEIYELRVEPYLDWDKQDLLCLSCLKMLIEHHLKLWGLRRLREGKSPRNMLLLIVN
jgi:hypothetical protein